MARILVTGFCSVPSPERSGAQVPHVLRALAVQHTVEVLTVRSGDQAYVEQFRGTRMLRVPISDGPRRSQVEAYRRALRRQLEGAEYDAVHVCDAFGGVVVLELRERLGYKVVFDLGRGVVGQELAAGDEILAAELIRDELSCIQGADLVLAPTEGAARYLKAKGGGDRVRLVPPGVDVDTFDWDHRTASGPARIFYSGAVSSGCGLHLLMRATAEVVARTEARLVLAGAVDPAYTRELQHLISQFSLAGRVDFLGAVATDAMPRAIANADICVVPTAPELSRRPLASFPTRMLEYMACCRVCVAPRRGTVTMLATNGEHALLFAPDDAIDLAAQVLRLLADAPLRERLAGVAYDRVRRQYTASATRRALTSAYRLIDRAFPEQEPKTNPRYERAARPDSDHSDSAMGEVQTAWAGEISAETVAEAVDDTDSGLFASPTAVTSVSGADDFTSPDLGVSLEPGGASDSWVVGQLPSSREADSQQLDTDGTPVDVVRLAPGRRPVDNHFVAGELETAAELADDAPPDDALTFTAAGGLLPVGDRAQENDGEPSGDA